MKENSPHYCIDILLFYIDAIFVKCKGLTRLLFSFTTSPSLSLSLSLFSFVFISSSSSPTSSLRYYQRLSRLRQPLLKYSLSTPLFISRCLFLFCFLYFYPVWPCPFPLRVFTLFPFFSPFLFHFSPHPEQLINISRVSFQLVRLCKYLFAYFPYLSVIIYLIQIVYSSSSSSSVIFYSFVSIFFEPINIFFSTNNFTLN